MSKSKLIPIARMPLNARHWYIFAVSSMEQLIGTALSTITGVMIPLILLLGNPPLSSSEQGILGASGLVGMAAGSFIIGKFMDESGYLLWFRFCPLVIALGAAGVYCSDSFWPLAFFLFVIGTGVGGGYSLDSGYISEIMPSRWANFFLGLAKATCSLGFIGGAVACYAILKLFPYAAVWPYLSLVLAALGLITFILRIRWYQSPVWLMEKGESQQAEKAAQEFLGPEAEVLPGRARKRQPSVSWRAMFSGDNLKKVILSGIPWACEGLGVYGFGVFLPILVMALGLQDGSGEGIPRIIESIETTVYINIFIAVGFGVGLAILHKVNLFRLIAAGFAICGIALVALLIAHLFGLPVWISLVSFIIFEIALNAGPHLGTFIAPSGIFPVAQRGVGMGIATMLGKLGAIGGVFFMPVILHLGGVVLVLLISALVQALGAYVTFVYARALKLW